MNENKLGVILLDGLILFSVSVGLAVVTNLVFSLIKPPTDTPIVTAIDRGKADGLAKTLDEVERESGPAGINLADEHGRTALMRAAYANLSNDKALAELDAIRAPMAATLLERGADINAKDDDGWTPLMWAAWSNLPQVMAGLLAKGADVSAADRQGNTALIIAARRGNDSIVAALLDGGADKNRANLAGLNALAAAERGLKEHSGSFYEARHPAYQRIIAALR